MKLRTTNNSIRIRIRKSELLQLKKDGRVEEQINFGNEVVFSFTLVIDKETEAINGSLEANTLVVRIPNTTAINWIESNEVSIESVSKVSETEELQILVEKDFPCLDRPNEDKSDTFWELVPQNEKTC
ncbi:MAG: hypothetical protein ACI9FN_003390 [Saprospiraceae bacterium]|jgi:hypothetical protein